MRLRFRGARQTFPYVPAADVLGARAPQELLHGRIAIIGGSAPGVQNLFVTPSDRLFPDAEIQATAIDNLLQGDSFRRPGEAQFWELAMALLVGLIPVFLVGRFHSLWGTLITFGLTAAVWVGCVLVLDSQGILLSPLAATAALIFNVPVLTSIHYLQEKNRADRTERRLTTTRQRSQRSCGRVSPAIGG